ARRRRAPASAAPSGGAAGPPGLVPRAGAPLWRLLPPSHAPWPSCLELPLVGLERGLLVPQALQLGVGGRVALGELELHQALFLHDEVLLELEALDLGLLLDLQLGDEVVHARVAAAHEAELAAEAGGGPRHLRAALHVHG